MDARRFDPPKLSSGCGCKAPCLAKLGGPALACLIPSAGYHLGMRWSRTCDQRWVNSLNQPTWTPSETFFDIVWTGAHVTLGIASYLVYKNGGGFSGAAKLPLMVYGGHVVTNWAWIPIFYGSKRIDYALYDCLALDATGALTAYLFYKIDQRAGLMLLPYLAWLGFETVLNVAYYKKNPRGTTITEIKEKKK